MATTSRKPGQRYWVTDWETNNKLLTDTAEHQRHHSQQTRQEGRALRHQTACKTRWDESDSRDRLVDRINEVTEQKDRLQFCVQAMEREIKALTQVKEETERALAETVVPLEVVVECLTQREGRRGSELVSDPLDGQLKREAQMIDTMQQELQQHISKAFEQLCCLKEAHQQLTFDLTNKTEALDVDLSRLSLTDRSPDISFKPDPTHVPTSASTQQEWEQFTHYNVTRAEEEMQASLQLRETMTSTRIQSQNDLEGQRITTGFNLRKRAHQLQQAWSQLHWQHTATREEITELLRDINHLEQELLATECPLKLVHTRLENRNSRPGVDLCRDQVHSGLVEEAKQLGATIEALQQNLAKSMRTLQSLEEQQACMGEDLSRKQEALELEQRSDLIRQHLEALSEAETVKIIPGVTVPIPGFTREMY
ncbi:tektin-2-like [Salvelinus fontinalis]|uniref:tektin-2-like n=1 Tax=Salvelinus fontinalis TaxID=8038 RepID=UPI0024858137|nr:tektin-2-like [Salvelinus fontinalis]